jgi:acetyltransferase-like isoleucine patch superfamily enzyme
MEISSHRKEFYRLFWKISFIKTLYFNLKYLPFKEARRLPVFISRNVYLRKVKGKIRFECPIKPALVRIGFDEVGIFDDKLSRCIWEVEGMVVFRGRADFKHGSKLSVGKSGTIILGEDFRISSETAIIANGRMEFGYDCRLAWNILVMDTDFHKIKDENGKIINPAEPIIFGDRVWVGCRSLILKGTNIPNSCVIGANSLVNKTLEFENCLYAGNPVKPIKKNITWEE